MAEPAVRTWRHPAECGTDRLVTQVATTFAGTEAVWRDVLAGDPAATFFSGHAWQSAWWRHFGDRLGLLLVVAAQAGRPAGIGPFAVGRCAGGTVVRFVGTGLSDYGDLIVDERVASRRDVVFAVLDAVRDRLPGAVLDLEQVPDRSGTVGLLAEWAAARGYRLWRFPQDRCPYQRLPPDVGLFDARRSQSTRRQDRRNSRALERLGPVWLVASGMEAGGLPALVEALAAVERAHCAAGRRINSFEGSRGAFLADGMSAAAAAGQLWLSGMSVGPTLVAYSVAFEQGGVLYGYLQGYRREYANYGPGTILLLHLQREAIRRGIHTVDYLRGAEPYKLRWQTGIGVNYRLLLRPAAAGPVARLAGLAHLLCSCWRDALPQPPVLRPALDRARRLSPNRHRGLAGRPPRFREAAGRAASYDS